MPELPEVESTVRALTGPLLGRRILACRVLWGRTIANTRAGEFVERVCDSTVDRISRRGKFILLSLSKAAHPRLTLLCHLRMSGYLQVLPPGADRTHDRVVFALDNGSELRFHDVRKFGRMWIAENHLSVTGKLGVEPLSADFTLSRFRELLAGKQTRIKSLLLDQRLIAGIGNIYADESLWRARIHPRTAGGALRPLQIAALRRAIRSVLRGAIKTHGTDSGDRVVRGGRYRPKVYGRAAKPCERCGAKVVRIVVGQRGTHICPHCQKPPRKAQRGTRERRLK